MAKSEYISKHNCHERWWKVQIILCYYFRQNVFIMLFIITLAWWSDYIFSMIPGNSKEFTNFSPLIKLLLFFSRMKPLPCGLSSGPNSMKMSLRHGWSSDISTTTTSWSIWWTTTFPWKTAYGRSLMICLNWLMHRLSQLMMEQSDYHERIPCNLWQFISCVFKKLLLTIYSSSRIHSIF